MSNSLFHLATVALLLTACSATGDDHSGSIGADSDGQAWTPLFDGTSLSAWRGFKKDTLPGGWALEEGCLVRRGQGGDIVTVGQYTDFELTLDWKIAEGGNSGIFFHVTEDQDTVWRTGPELQILDNARHRDGDNPKTSAGSNYALHGPPLDSTRPVGEWNRVRLLVDGAHVEHWMNGVKQCEYELWSDSWRKLVEASKFNSMPDYGMRKSGHIALQDHGDLVWFRDIRIREL